MAVPVNDGGLVYNIDFCVQALYGAQELEDLPAERQLIYCVFVYQCKNVPYYLTLSFMRLGPPSTSKNNLRALV